MEVKYIIKRMRLMIIISANEPFHLFPQYFQEAHPYPDFLSLPLNGCGRLGTDVVNYTVHAFHLVDDLVGDLS